MRDPVLVTLRVTIGFWDVCIAGGHTSPMSTVRGDGRHVDSLEP